MLLIFQTNENDILIHNPVSFLEIIILYNKNTNLRLPILIILFFFQRKNILQWKCQSDPRDVIVYIRQFS